MVDMGGCYLYTEALYPRSEKVEERKGIRPAGNRYEQMVSRLNQPVFPDKMEYVVLKCEHKTCPFRYRFVISIVTRAFPNF